MKLIDADAWWKAVQEHYTDGDCADDDRYELGINVGITKSRNVMMSAPSIDIVRCGECKWLRYCETEDLEMYLDCDHPDGGGIPRSEEWYCADGEREGE